MRSKEKNIALVLSSGGARGIAQIGVINELKQNGFEIKSLSGSSIGSVVGGMYAMGKLEEFSTWLSSLNRMDVFNLMDFTISTHGVLKLEKLFKIMEKDFPDMLIENFSIPYVAMATDIANSREMEFTSGSVYKAMRASVALPAIIKSVQEKDHILVDGGVLNPLPIRQIQRTPNDILVVVNLYGYDKDKNLDKTDDFAEAENFNDLHLNSEQIPEKNLIERLKNGKKSIQKKRTINNNYASILKSVITLMLQTNASTAIELYKPDMVIDIPYSCASTFDFHKAEKLIQVGRVAAQKSIRDYANSISKCNFDGRII